ARVLVSFREPRADGGVRIGYAPTLAEALDQVFGPGAGRAATAPGGDAATAPPLQTRRPAPPLPVPPAAPQPGPGDSPATVAELKEALAELRAALDRLQRAVDAFETGGG
ncbi:MAG TPA: membrane protein, partial [Mycobacterium sp.]